MNPVPPPPADAGPTPGFDSGMMMPPFPTEDGSTPPPPPMGDASTPPPPPPPTVDCSPMDVSASDELFCEGGGFRDVLGYHWNGTVCTPLVGCTCEGEDCAMLFASSAECESMIATPCADAPPPPADDPCDPYDATATVADRCEDGSFPDVIGYTWTGSTCIPLVGCDCEGEDCGDLFGTSEGCQREQRVCLLPIDPALCEPMNARSDNEEVCEGGGFADVLGYRWNGRACVPLVGCECIGAECGDLFESSAACQTERGACLELDDFGF